MGHRNISANFSDMITAVDRSRSIHASRGGVSAVAAGFLMFFGSTLGNTGLATGTPLEILFVPFGLGMLLLIIGHAALSLGVRRAGFLGGWWRAPLVAAGGALVVFADPWHDLGLLTFNAAWVAIGTHMIKRAS